MEKLVDKFVILIVSLALYIPTANSIYMIVPILIAIILSAILSYLENDRITILVFIFYIGACFFESVLLFFIPLICYDAIFPKIKWIGLLSFLPLIINYNQALNTPTWLIAALILVTYILKYRTLSLQKAEKNYYRLRDNTMEVSMQLKKQNEELLEKQDYEINLATLTERNRIARDIHDNVGHLLSRSILQTGALLVINKDEETKDSLKSIKNTLAEAMEKIRASVHDLHDESIDLQTEIQKLIDNFDFCKVEFNYDAETNIDKNIKYCFIAVTKEALSNIINHSNASKASIVIREHPAIYQLVIQDNGTNSGYNSEKGIGIKNIKDRVSALNGNVNINTDRGFRIFISIPKE